MFRPALATIVLAAASAVAAADPAPATYALVVGSNAGGAGQAELRFAEDDAHEVATVLHELGDYPAAAIDVVEHPTPAELRAHLDQLTARVQADAAAGRRARVFFYYSGHARAEAIDLGPDEVPLAELRQRLAQIPAALTIVVLDACQSGAFSRVKGAAPAADFSYNSRQRLDATGFAVLASSSGSELSQESDQLRSSYFTHHLLVGLRGAGDANHDGQVTLDEAYQYAYHQTLLATAATAVGGQHVTFEADLEGHGEVALSFPRAATTAIVLPSALEGQTLVEDRKANTVVAETYKARGAPVRIAVAPGDYEVLVRHGTTLSRCEVTPDGSGALDLGTCHDEAIVAATTKGGDGKRRQRFEVDGLIGGIHDDGFTRTLQNFGYQRDLFDNPEGMRLLTDVEVAPHVWLGMRGDFATSPTWKRQLDQGDLTFKYVSVDLAAVAHGEVALASEGFGSRVYVYGELAAGAALAFSVTDNNSVGGSQAMDNNVGPFLSAGAGLRVQGNAGSWWRSFGATLGYEYQYSPTVTNLIGDTHDIGGSRVMLGFDYQYRSSLWRF